MSGDWLPPIITLNSFGGDWITYLEHIYDHYCQDFVGVDLHFRGVRLALKRHPELEGKEATFWHLISSGPIETERLPDMRRSERVCWPRAMIEAANQNSPDVLVWRNTRQTKRGLEKNIILALKDFSYMVILRDRETYVLLWTAFTISNTEKLKKEYLASLQGP